MNFLAFGVSPWFFYFKRLFGCECANSVENSMWGVGLGVLGRVFFGVGTAFLSSNPLVVGSQSTV